MHVCEKVGSETEVKVGMEARVEAGVGARVEAGVGAGGKTRHIVTEHRSTSPTWLTMRRVCCYNWRAVCGCSTKANLAACTTKMPLIKGFRDGLTLPERQSGLRQPSCSEGYRRRLFFADSCTAVCQLQALLLGEVHEGS